MDKFEILMGKASDQDKAELTILYNANIKAAKAYNADPTSGKKKDWDAARDGLEDITARLWKKYGGENSGATDDPVFENIFVLVEQLEKQGFKISKSKAYRDRRSGILRVQTDGTVLPSDARAYALTLKKVGVSPVNIEKLHEEKSQKEVERLTLEIEKIKFNLDRERGKYLLKEDFIMEMSARAAVLDIGLRHMVHTKAAEWIRMVGGKSEKNGVYIDMLNDDIDNLMNDFAALDRFQVVFMDKN